MNSRPLGRKLIVRFIHKIVMQNKQVSNLCGFVSIGK
jgi:hypothetical protein